MAQLDRASLLKQVRNPLAFFVLALLVVEGVIGALATWGLPAEDRINAVWAMAVVLIAVVAVVAAITFWRPRHRYDEVDELKQSINSKGFRDAGCDNRTPETRVSARSRGGRGQ